MANFNLPRFDGAPAAFQQALERGALTNSSLTRSKTTPNLRVKASSPPPWDRRALNLGSFLNRTLVRNDSLSSTDTFDLYKITVSARSYLTLAVTGFTRNVAVDLYYGNGSRFATLDEPGLRREFTANMYTGNPNTSTSTAPGTYYIRVYAREGGLTNYKMTILSIVQ